jgi:putative hemolysin
MSAGEITLWLLVMLAGLAGSSLWSGLETGFYCIDRVRLAVRTARGETAAAKITRELDRPDALLGTILIGNNASNYIGTYGLTVLLAATALAEWQLALLQVAVLSPLLLVFGETLPKEIMRGAADRLPYRLVNIVLWVRRLLTVIGLVPAVLLFGRLAGKLIGGGEAAAGAASRARTAELLHESVAAGALSQVQGSLVDRALAFGRATVADEMIPWQEVATASVTWSRERILRHAQRSGHTRLVMLGARGKVIGVLNQIDLHLSPELEVRELVRPAAVVHPDDGIRETIIAVREAGPPLAIVKEAGRPIGIVTVKDLVEPLVGDLKAW